MIRSCSAGTEFVRCLAKWTFMMQILSGLARLVAMVLMILVSALTIVMTVVLNNLLPESKRPQNEFRVMLVRLATLRTSILL